MFLTEMPAVQRVSSAKPDARSDQDLRRDFQRFMKKLDGMQESDARRARQRAQQNDSDEEKRQQARKSCALKARIAQLRSQLAADPGNQGAAAELSMAQTQLYWLNNAL